MYVLSQIVEHCKGQTWRLHAVSRVQDWDDMERIWNWVYTQELGILSEEVRANADSANLTDTMSP